MPGCQFLPGGDNNAGTGAITIFEERLRFGFGEHGRLHCLALAVQLVQLLRNHVSLRAVIQCQKTTSKGCVPDTSAGIDAGADQKAEMIGRDRPPKSRLLEEGRQPDIVHVACGNQSLDHISAVQALQRHNITDRRQRHDVEIG